MRPSLPRSHRSLFAGAIAGVLAMTAVGLVVAAQQNDDTTIHTPADFPPPVFNRWVSPVTGKFTVPLWDDRELSAEQKAANPLPPDPRWEPFGRCVASAGFETRADSSKPFTQADLDSVVNQVNVARPDSNANKALGNEAANLPGLPGAFVKCADQWLAIPVSEFAAHDLPTPAIKN